ncbi:MAG: glycoside hydrolase family 20 zincin-like fold domain-containing protein, partial [Acidimicrobiales bacterium]
MAEPLLVPVPRDVDLSERRLPDDVAISEIVDPSLPPQGYELTLTDSAVTLQHADDAGRRYGLQTLEQL